MTNVPYNWVSIPIPGQRGHSVLVFSIYLLLSLNLLQTASTAKLVKCTSKWTSTLASMTAYQYLMNTYQWIPEWLLQHRFFLFLVIYLFFVQGF